MPIWFGDEVELDKFVIVNLGYNYQGEKKLGKLIRLTKKEVIEDIILIEKQKEDSARLTREVWELELSKENSNA